MADGQLGATSVPAEVGSNDLLGGWLSANAGKLVAGVLAPVFAVLSPALAGFANEVFKLHLSPQQVSNVGIAIVVGLGLMGFKWLSNRGEWERAMLDIQKAFLLGRAAVPAEAPAAVAAVAPAAAAPARAVAPADAPTAAPAAPAAGSDQGSPKT